MESEFKDKNIVFIGIKPFMSYCTALKMQFDKNDEVEVKARGKCISTACDVIEFCKRNFLKDWNIIYKGINIGSETFMNDDGKEITVSTMEIKLKKELQILIEENKKQIQYIEK
jgi:DNA-binding protein Alba